MENKEKMNRRDFLKGVGLGLGLISFPAFLSRTGVSQQEPTLYTSIRSLTNPYHATWNEGAELFANDMGLDHQTLLYEGNSERQINQIRTAVSKTGSKSVFNIDPNQSPVARSAANFLEENDCYFVTQWNKPEDLHPWEYNYYVSHVATNMYQQGYQTAKVLFDSLNGEGEILALEGLLANTAANLRFEGLKEALSEYPNISMLDHQTAEWDRTEALNLTETWLTQYGGKIDGIWAANDNMAIGALEALRARGLRGEVPVTGTDAIEEAVQAIMDGYMVATTSSDPYWQGGMGLSLPYHAQIGEIDVNGLARKYRSWYYKVLLITSDNAEDYFNNYIESIPDYDWTDFWGKFSKPAYE